MSSENYQKFPFPYRDVYEAIRQTLISNKYRIEMEDDLIGRFEVKSGWSLFSFGETLWITVEDVDGWATLVGVRSQLSVAENKHVLYSAEGRNAKHITTIMSGVSQYLREHGSPGITSDIEGKSQSQNTKTEGSNRDDIGEAAGPIQIAKILRCKNICSDGEDIMFDCPHCGTDAEIDKQTLIRVWQESPDGLITCPINGCDKKYGAPTLNETRQIYIHKNGQQLGPYSPEEVSINLSQGTLLLNDAAWHDGLDDWVYLSFIKDLLPQEAIALKPAFSASVNPNETNLNLALKEKKQTVNKSSKEKSCLPLHTRFVNWIKCREDALEWTKRSSIIFFFLTVINIGGLTLIKAPPMYFIIPILCFIAALGVRFGQSRAAAVGLFLFAFAYLCSSCIMKTGSILPAFFALLMAGRAIEATFALHGRFANE